MPPRQLPSNLASVATPDQDGRLDAPSARRNLAIISQELLSHAPETGRALELASGTGQHVAAFTAALPGGLTWQPTEIDPVRRVSIDAWVQDADQPNLRPAISLDATTPGWGARHGEQNLIVLINLLHLISTAEVRILLTEVAQALTPSGTFFLYGPFLRDGQATSEGDARFDQSLRQSDPEIGYESIEDICLWLKSAGLNLREVIQMPANNLAIICQKPDTLA